VLGAYLPTNAVGIYQGGLRIFMAATTAAGVLTNVLLPRAALEMAVGERQSTWSGNCQVILIFSAFGSLVGWLFALVLPPLVVIIYGPAFEPLMALMPWFGLLFAARLVAGSWGLLLTAKGEQRYRTISSLAHWVLIAVVASVAIPTSGSLGWIVAMLIGTLFLFIVYLMRALRLVKVKTVAVAASASPLAILAYILFSYRAV